MYSRVRDFDLPTAKFLAGSRDDVEWLIGEVERLRSHIAGLTTSPQDEEEGVTP